MHFVAVNAAVDVDANMTTLAAPKAIGMEGEFGSAVAAQHDNTLVH